MNIAQVKHHFSSEVKRRLVGVGHYMADHKAMLNEPQSVRKRLRDAMRHVGMSNKGLSDAVGISIQGVGEWLRTGKIARDRIPAIVAAINAMAKETGATPITISWFMIGDTATQRDKTMEGGAQVPGKEATALAQAIESLPEHQRAALRALIDSFSDKESKSTRKARQ